MQALLDERDYQTIADKVLDLIKKDYDLVPKKPAKAIIGMEEFRTLAHGKAPDWIKLFIFHDFPETKEWAFGVGMGTGHPIKINYAKAKEWMDKHESEIDWSQSLPQ